MLIPRGVPGSRISPASTFRGGRGRRDLRILKERSLYETTNCHTAVTLARGINTNA